MQMLEGPKYFYMVLNGLMTQDPDDILRLEDHAMDSEIKCITNTATRRSVQLKPGIFMMDVDHFNDLEGRSLIKTVAAVEHVEPMIDMIIDYLNGKSDYV